MYIYTYNRKSKTARALARELDAELIYKQDRLPVFLDFPVINWGATNIDHAFLHVINIPAAVAQVSDKLRFFRMMDGMGLTPEWSDEYGDALDWIADEGIPVVCRTVLNGHSGEGIVLAENSDFVVVEAPLYVQYIPKKWEFRVHVFNGRVIDFQQKARKASVPDDQVNWKVRSHRNGFIYKREIDVPLAVCEEVKRLALECMNVTALNFGAVDVIWNEQRGRGYVLEINTAPGLTGTTLQRYVEAFQEYI